MKRIDLSQYEWTIPDPPVRVVTAKGMVFSLLFSALFSFMVCAAILPLVFPVLTFIQAGFIGLLLVATDNSIFRFTFE